MRAFLQHFIICLVLAGSVNAQGQGRFWGVKLDQPIAEAMKIVRLKQVRYDSTTYYDKQYNEETTVITIPHTEFDGMACEVELTFREGLLSRGEIDFRQFPNGEDLYDQLMLLRSRLGQKYGKPKDSTGMRFVPDPKKWLTLREKFKQLYTMRGAMGYFWRSPVNIALQCTSGSKDGVEYWHNWITYRSAGQIKKDRDFVERKGRPDDY